MNTAKVYNIRDASGKLCIGANTSIMMRIFRIQRLKMGAIADAHFKRLNWYEY